MPVEMEWREVYHNGERRVLSAEGEGKVFEHKPVQRQRKSYERAAWLVTCWRLVSLYNLFLQFSTCMLWISCSMTRTMHS